MAPSKASRNNNHNDDGKTDAPAKEKNSGGGGGGHTSTKMRRGASQQTSGPQHRDPPSAPTSAPAQAPSEAPAPTLPWSSFDRRSLHAYVREHELNTSASYSSPFHYWVLSQPRSIGLYSPTMVRKRQARRQSKDQLAMAVRKHFNGLGVQENDVVVDFIFKVRNDKAIKHGGPNNKQHADSLD